VFDTSIAAASFHELAEAITDPLVSGWHDDTTGAEIGDTPCRDAVDSIIPYVNVLGGGSQLVVQELFSRKTNTCSPVFRVFCSTGKETHESFFEQSYYGGVCDVDAHGAFVTTGGTLADWAGDPQTPWLQYPTIGDLTSIAFLTFPNNSYKALIGTSQQESLFVAVLGRQIQYNKTNSVPYGFGTACVPPVGLEPTECIAKSGSSCPTFPYTRSAVFNSPAMCCVPQSSFPTYTGDGVSGAAGQTCEDLVYY
jgi:hypothetical protein